MKVTLLWSDLIAVWAWVTQILPRPGDVSSGQESGPDYWLDVHLDVIITGTLMQDSQALINVTLTVNRNLKCVKAMCTSLPAGYRRIFEVVRPSWWRTGAGMFLLLYNNVGNMDPPAVTKEGLTQGCKLLSRIRMKGWRKGGKREARWRGMNVKEFWRFLVSAGDYWEQGSISFILY